MSRELVQQWRQAFMADLEVHEVADPFRQVADGRRLKEWTRLLTGSVVRSCQSIGWLAAARGHKLAPLPQVQSEYLAIDVMAFPSNSATWPPPIAVFELENSSTDDRVAYSLWKVLSVRAPVRVVFAYRRSWDEVYALLAHLEQTVIPSLSLPQRVALGDGVALVAGIRGQETFPWGYFRTWHMDTGVGRFQLL